jgi:4-hydroxybenzoate polyprenyltransferase
MESVQTTANQGRVADAPSGHWVYRILPKTLWPYAQLARWDRPIGWQLLLWPCWWSAALAAQTWGQLPNIWHLIFFLIGAIAMRGAGCTYNDIVDVKIDAQVERTRSRPLPSGQITKRAAWAFLVVQALTGFVVLIQFNWFSVGLGIASLGVVAAYPFMKRITNWPQLVLGLAFSWGALIGWAAFLGSLNIPPILLFVATVLWVIGYDTIYAHQDREDDALVGVGSTARLFGANTKPALIALYSGMIILMAAAFYAANAHGISYVGLLAAAIHLARQIKILDINDADQCLKLFKSNSLIGGMIFLALFAGSILMPTA